MTSPRFVLSKQKVLEQYNKVRPLSDIVSYSSKTNQVVTKILEEDTDSIFSIHSSNELKHINNMNRVIFLAQGWREEEIRQLLSKGISWFVVDNESDLDVLLAYLENNDVSISLLLRLRLKENTLRTEKYFVFGMTSETVNRKIMEIKNNLSINEKLNHLGIHFHRKTQNMAEWSLLYELSNVVPEEVLQAINIVNMGGGLPAEYANTNVDVLPGIINKIDEFREWLRKNDIKMIIEPGRFIAAPSCRLMTKIIGIHQNNIIVNASVYNSNMDALIVPVKLLVEGELPKEHPLAKPFVIKGITPCSMDLFRYRVYLNNPRVGDQLVFLNAGAYNFSTDFCDLEKIETVVEQ